VRLAAIKSLRNIQLNEDDLSYVSSLLTNHITFEGYLKNLLGRAKEIILGIGPCGITTKEKIQIAGTLVKLYKDYSIFEITLNKKNIKQEPEEWNEVIIDTIAHFDAGSIEKFLGIINEIKNEDSKTALSILESFAEVLNSLEQKTKEIVVSSILTATNPAYSPMMYISQKDISDVRIDIDDETIEKLLDYKTFSISNFAFDIFCHNHVIC
jgi:hypothetical protein